MTFTAINFGYLPSMRSTVQAEPRVRSAVQAERRVQLIALAEAVAELAENRNIKANRVHAVRDDLEIRPVLDTIVRRWTRLVPTTLHQRRRR